MGNYLTRIIKPELMNDNYDEMSNLEKDYQNEVNEVDDWVDSYNNT